MSDQYRWVGSHAFRDHANDRVIEPGEELPEDIADQIAAAHPHDVEPIDEGGGGDPVGDMPPFPPQERTVEEIQDTLDEYDYPEDALEALEAAERDGKDRDTALDAITEARE
ncbi:hypothetical protein [Natrinema ejinorense]|uniref:Uncharacterized protein n=1 Tax=Natrinema ejinorense TaxID=373386 RepID=A0A2A5QR93_9EURY|nr:hypothetical protein [Natrinema ejinorense]PCR89315.1 hypothetical protein CP557_01440 [Natrinema ejinorense]